MSADNTIAILKTPVMNGVGFEFRVAHCQAIDNIWTNTDGSKNEDGEPHTIVDYFGDCDVLQNEKEARELAFKKQDEIEEDGGWVEYGIMAIEFPYAFDYYWMKANADTA